MNEFSFVLKTIQVINRSPTDSRSVSDLRVFLMRLHKSKDNEDFYEVCISVDGYMVFCNDYNFCSRARVKF